MGKKILLAGCGQLGSRHLQAISLLKDVSDICVYDPMPQSLELGQNRVNEVENRNKDIKYTWVKELDEALANGDLCIVSTRAKGRCALVKDISKKLEYKKFILEKVVSPSIAEYEDLLAFEKDKKLKIWVNCKTRAYGIHKYIKSRIDSAYPVMLSDLGGNHGLGNNGVHSADLFAFYDGGDKIDISGSRVDQVLHSSKRGNGVYDLTGTLYGSTKKGSDFVLSFEKDHVSPDIITIISKDARFIVDHFQKFAYESYEKDKWDWKNIPINENWNVSNMSRTFINDILSKGGCELPTLEECFPGHEFILSQLLPHFNKLLGKKDDICPIT